MGYAGYNALRASYLGHYATVASHAARWRQMADWAKAQGIKDAAQITQDTLTAYGESLKEKVVQGDMAVAYAQNLISSANVTLSVLRGDNRITLSPSATVGERSTIRETAPCMDRQAVRTVIESLKAQGYDRAAAVVNLARELGLREREAILLDINKAIRSAESHGKINVQEGTKGGRSADRWVPVSETAKITLQAAKNAANGARNLIPPGQNFNQFRHQVQNVALPLLAEQTHGHLHDLRSAYACERDEELTGYPAPVVAGVRQADKSADSQARLQIAFELGHNRVNVTSVYLGSAR